MPTDFADFERRDRETTATIHQVIDRQRNKPSPFRSYGEYTATLAAAYQARAEFWDDLLDHVIDHWSDPVPRDVALSALLDAHHFCRDSAVQQRHESWQFARREQDRAYATYTDNIATSRARAAHQPVHRAA